MNESRPIVRGEPWHIIRIFFRCEAKNGNVILSGDHDDYLWIDPSEYRKHPIIENLHPAFETLMKE